MSGAGRARRLRLAGILFTLAMAIVAVSAAPGQAVAEAAKTYRHASGLEVIVGQYREPGQVPASLSEALGAAEQLAERSPDQFGQPWVDRGSETVVVDVVTAKGAATLEAALRGDRQGAASLEPRTAVAGKPLGSLAGLEAAGAAGRLRQRNVARSSRTLETVKEELTRLASDPAFQADDLWMSRVDAPSNRVIVTVSSLSDALAGAIAARYGTATVAVEVDEAEAKAEPAIGRWADNSPFYGGSRLSLGCTDAFSWVSGSTSQMLTAGHCIPNGGSVSTMTSSLGGVTSGTRENWNTSVGSQYLVNDLSGTNVYRGDMALITVTGTGRSSAGRIYRGNSNSTSSAPVTGMFSRRSASGDQFCTGGSSRKSDGSAGPGEICGWTVDVARVNVESSTDGVWWRNVIRAKSKTGWCNRPGDSGAPVYIVNGSGSVTAKGILDGAGGGGTDYYGGQLDKCIGVVFTDIWEPFYGFPGVIRTG